MEQTTVLLADDEETLRKNLAQVLREEHFNVIACADGTEALKALRAPANGTGPPVDAIITDLRMPGIPGMDLIDHAKKLAPEAIIVVITAFGEVQTAVDAMKKGAREYICKPLIFDEVIFKLKRLLAHDVLAKENKMLREQIKRSQYPVGIIGRSAAIGAIKETIHRVCHTMSNVLIGGESGTGKEVAARALHYSGVTKDKAFVAVNCGGLTDTLVESELFGYRRGAFTGAEKDRTGYFEAANGGTLFLDEIGNLPLHAQAILLRAIEQKAIMRVGDNRPRPVNIRIVVATNRDLEKAVDAGDFREDLYFRLNVIRMTIPPLRERPEDIPELVDHFVKKYNAELKCSCPGFSAEALDALCKHSWRGNVRELENAVERTMIFANGNEVGTGDLSIATGAGAGLNSQTYSVDLRRASKEFEVRHIAKVLASVGNNKISAAAALGIGLSSLYRKLEDSGIPKASTELAESA